MTRPVRIGIIGAGMTGLACARKLVDAGHAPLLLDKGRGIGGRLATRRAENDLQFDHGAQYVTANSEGFQSLLNELTVKGAAGKWHMGDRTGFVGTPSMNALAKALADGLTIRRQTQVTSVAETGSSWSVTTGDDTLEFDRLIVTTPAPQTRALLGNDHPLSKQIAHVTLLPCWTLMADFEKVPAALKATYHDPDAPLAWFAQESTKPERASKNTFVAQASPHWSQSHLELEKPAATDLMLTELCKVLGLDRANVVHADTHRWRYAKVDTPLGSPYLANTPETLFLGGDWCIGARVEAAWQSGTSIAEKLLEQL